MAKTTRTTTPRPQTTAAPAPDAASATEPPADTAADTPGAEALGLKLLVEQVISRTDLKKKEVKPVVEATLAILGEALASGQPLNLPAFGRMRINRKKENPKGETMTLRLRRGGGGGGKGAEKDAENAKEPLAVADE